VLDVAALLLELEELDEEVEPEGDASSLFSSLFTPREASSAPSGLPL
jgi:hypothetical protein